MGKRYLVIGSGGREHALSWKLAHDDDTSHVWVAPGNAGIAADDAIFGCVDISASDFGALADFAEENDVDLTVVGPEAPLCDGLADFFEERGLLVFGPSAAAAELEASKSFAKEIMAEADVPTAGYSLFEDLDGALAHIERSEHPLVIKADGLAGGKGVVISTSFTESRQTLESFMADEKFGEASRTILVEDFLRGPEMSFMVVSDGERVVPLSTSQDHKRVGEGDVGPNTGGMGAVTPSPHASAELRDELLQTVIRPVIDTMARRGTPFRGFLYAGLMLTEHGPRVLEFNVRLGDPETQALLFAMEEDLGPWLEAAARGELPEGTLETQRAGCCVVLASEGYPLNTKKGFPISGLDAVSGDHVKVFHAGTRREEDGEFVTAGGRVLGVTARGDDVDAAKTLAYEAVGPIDWEGMHYRRDIGRVEDLP